jgi:hypothetical protein
MLIGSGYFVIIAFALFIGLVAKYLVEEIA